MPRAAHMMRGARVNRSVLTLCLALALLGQRAALAEPEEAPKPPGLFLQAKEAIARETHILAAKLFWQYLASTKAGEEKYESAQFYLGRALQELGFVHASVEYYFQVANNRRTPELLPRTIKFLEEISLAHPFDEDLVIRDLIGDTDFGDLSGELADFIYYWQGITNLRRGLHAWASERFDKIDRKGYYYFSSLYVSIIRLLDRGSPEVKKEAVTSFAYLFGSLDLGAALEALRRRGEGDSKLVYSIKALLDEDNTIKIHFDKLPSGWEVELAILGMARIAGETRSLLKRAKNTDQEALVMPLSYLVQVAGSPIYLQSVPFEDRAEAIKAVASRYEAVRRIRGQALHALGRLLYEQKRYIAAYETLGKIPRNTELVSEILLERAWAKFKAGDPHRAMGLLYALDAPVFRTLFAPEKFTLRGLIYKQFCHFRAAKLAARRFKESYTETVEKVRNGVPITEIEIIRKASVRHGQTRKLFLFLRSLKREQEAIGKYDEWDQVGLSRHLQELYKQKMAQITDDLNRSLEESAAHVAEDLLKAEEQVNLLEYEVGQAIFQRVSDAAGQARVRKLAAKIPLYSSRIYYPFVGEYWTKELPFYKFNISDRCVE